jgi:uncharacterized membrane protein
MSATGIFHLTFSLLAVGFGGIVVFLGKGTRWHRTWGHAYVWSMAGVVGTSFALFDLTGRVTPFHLAAVVAGVTVLGGMWTVLMRRPRKHWIEAHATWMAWSYVGLMAAFVAESLTRFVMPVLESTLERNALWPAFWVLVALGSFGTFGVGVALIRRRLPGSIASVPAVMRREREAVGTAESRT